MAAQFSRYLLDSAVLILLSCFVASATGQTYGERLGWKPEEVVVILHVDDAGMSHPSNRGVIEAAEHGVATSCAVMMPCSWVSEIAHYLQAHPNTDSGLHLTLTSEWKQYRWGPLAGRSQVPGLVDSEGCLWASVEDVARHASPEEVEREIRAQIERAERLQIPITHLDSHMGTLFARPDYYAAFAKVGIEKRIPILAVSPAGTHLAVDEQQAAARLSGWPEKLWRAGLPVLDDLYTGFTSLKGDKTERLIQVLKELKPGITEILFHASEPTEEFPLITGSSEARRADLKALTDGRIRQAIHDRGIVLTTWRELMVRRAKAPAGR